MAVSFPTATSLMHSAAVTARLTTSVASPQRIMEERICVGMGVVVGGRGHVRQWWVP